MRITTANEITQEPGLPCKTEGCENRVPSYKGMSGWCNVQQLNGSTHRKDEIERRRRERGLPPKRSVQQRRSAPKPVFPSKESIDSVLVDLVIIRDFIESGHYAAEACARMWNEALDRLRVEV